MASDTIGPLLSRPIAVDVEKILSPLSEPSKRSAARMVCPARAARMIAIECWIGK